jgi:putative phosphoribosyl transferase
MNHHLASNGQSRGQSTGQLTGQSTGQPTERQLHQQLAQYHQHPAAIVCGIPGEGLPLAREVAVALNLPLAHCLVRKLVLPTSPTLTIGAVAANRSRILNYDVINHCGITAEAIAQCTIQALRSLQHDFRSDQPAYQSPAPKQPIIILVDDGIGTGAAVRAAIAQLAVYRPAKVVLVLPSTVAVAADQLAALVDESVAFTRLATPSARDRPAIARSQPVREPLPQLALV